MDDKLQECINRCLAKAREARENCEPQQAQHFECSICHDTEWIMTIDENGRDVAKPCQCREKKNAIRRMRNSGISEDDLKKGFNDFVTDSEKLKDVKMTAVKYFSHFGEIENERCNSLLLSGASGRGKTTLGMAVANNLIQSGVNVRYMPYRDEVTRLKQEITDEQTYKEHMWRLKRARVLFIDDLLKGKYTESDVNILYEIINYRYLEHLPIIVSTEKTVMELLAFDEAVGGRILEMAKAYTAIFDSSIPNFRTRSFSMAQA